MASVNLQAYEAKSSQPPAMEYSVTLDAPSVIDGISVQEITFSDNHCQHVFAASDQKTDCQKAMVWQDFVQMRIHAWQVVPYTRETIGKILPQHKTACAYPPDYFRRNIDARRY